MTEHDAGQPVIDARGVDLGYAGRPVVCGVEMTVRPGERWFIVGPNGHGKTTLVRSILGVLHPLTGTLSRHAEFMAPTRLGFVPQRCGISPSLPIAVDEFVSLGTVGQDASRRERRERVAEALRRVDLADRARDDYWSLSGGQQQRALLARALAREPGVLILDEPAAGLDLPGEQALMDILMQFNRERGLTTLLVTHNVEVVARFATHVALVHHGAVDAGPVDDVLADDRLERAFGVPLRVRRDGEGAATITIGGASGEAS